MSRHMVPATSNEPFIRYEHNGEEHFVPADVEGTLPDEAKITGTYDGPWFARLSAPGYLDCTDWEGPQPTKDAALYGLWFTFGDDDTFIEFIEGKKHIIAGSLRVYGKRDELYGWSVEDMADVHIATMGDVDEGYDPNDDHDLEEAYDFVLCNAIETANFMKQFKEAEKDWGSFV